LGKYTKSQRNAIYKLAHEKLYSKSIAFGCSSIAHAIFDIYGTEPIPAYEEVDADNFPEFFRFQEPDAHNVLWLDNVENGLSATSDEGNNLRQDVLSFCVEMTND
jgi:hypothetical protein